METNGYETPRVMADKPKNNSSPVVESKPDLNFLHLSSKSQVFPLQSLNIYSPVCGSIPPEFALNTSNNVFYASKLMHWEAPWNVLLSFLMKVDCPFSNAPVRMEPLSYDNVNGGIVYLLKTSIPGASCALQADGLNMQCSPVKTHEIVYGFTVYEQVCHAVDRDNFARKSVWTSTKPFLLAVHYSGNVLTTKTSNLSQPLISDTAHMCKQVTDSIDIIDLSKDEDSDVSKPLVITSISSVKRNLVENDINVSEIPKLKEIRRRKRSSLSVPVRVRSSSSCEIQTDDFESPEIEMEVLNTPPKVRKCAAIDNVEIDLDDGIQYLGSYSSPLKTLEQTTVDFLGLSPRSLEKNNKRTNLGSIVPSSTRSKSIDCFSQLSRLPRNTVVIRKAVEPPKMDEQEDVVIIDDPTLPSPPSSSRKIVQVSVTAKELSALLNLGISVCPKQPSS